MAEKTLEKKYPQEEIVSTDKLELATKYHQDFLIKSSGEDLVNAINCYIDAIKENPENASAYYRLAVLMYENKQIGIDGAIEQCERAISIDKNNPDARMYLGYFLSIKGEKEKAISELKKAIELSPKGKSRARFVMALELLEKENNEKGFLDTLKGLVYIMQASFISIFDKAALKMFAKNLMTDINYLKYNTMGKILEKFKCDKDAYQIYSDALDNTKNAPEFYEKMAKIAIKKKRPTVALQCFENASKLSGGHPVTLINTIEFMQEVYPDKIDELIDYYNLLVTKLPEYSRPYYELGHLYLKKEDYISALNAFKMALKNDENNPYYLNSLAFTYVQLEQYDTAIKLYNEAVKINPDNEWTAVVAQALAAIYYKIKNCNEAAISVLEYALTLTKSRGSIYTLLGDIYFDAEDMELSVKYYNMGLMEGMKDAKIYARIAMAYYEMNSIQDAIDCYNLAIETDRCYDIAHNNLGVIYLDALNDVSRALSYLVNAVDLNPDYMLAHFNLGRCYEKLGRKVEAATEYQKAIDLNAQTNEIDEEIIREKLYELFKA